MVLGEESGSPIESNCTSQHRAELNDCAYLCGKLAAAAAAVAAAVVDIEKCGPVVEHGSRQPLSCHPQCRGTRSTKLDMITYKRVMLPALQPLNRRCTLHRIKVNTEPLFAASEVGRCKNTTRVTRFLSFPSS